MALLGAIRKYFYHRKLQRKIRQRSGQGRITNYLDAQTVGVLYDASEPRHAETAHKYIKRLEQEGKKVESLAFVKSVKKDQKIPFTYFTKKQVSFFHFPDSKAVNRFINQPFDLLVNLYTEENPALEYIAAVSKARYRVGRFIEDRTYCFDLMVDMGQQKDLNYLVQQIDHLLNKINTKAHAV